MSTRVLLGRFGAKAEWFSKCVSSYGRDLGIVLEADTGQEDNEDISMLGRLQQRMGIPAA